MSKTAILKEKISQVISSTNTSGNQKLDAIMAAIEQHLSQSREVGGYWQLCPKCNGDGHLGRYNSPAIVGTNDDLICDVCNGKKILATPSLPVLLTDEVPSVGIGSEVEDDILKDKIIRILEEEIVGTFDGVSDAADEILKLYPSPQQGDNEFLTMQFPGKDGSQITNDTSDEELEFFMNRSKKEIVLENKDVWEWIAIFYGALHELVELKELKETLYKGNHDGKEYAERKPLAWNAARQAVELWKKSDYGAKPAKVIEIKDGIEQYQRLFNAIASTNGTALQSEMDEIIGIVREDFPPSPQPPAEVDKAARVVEALKWISCKDRLPDEGERVLCYRQADTIPEAYYCEVGAYGFYNKNIWGERETDNWTVTHWQPLPSPPPSEPGK